MNVGTSVEGHAPSCPPENETRDSRRRRRGALHVVCAALGAGMLLLASASAAKDRAQARATVAPTVITGDVTYTERLTLAPDAALRVRLLDVLSTAPAKVVAEHTMRATGTLPIRFALPFNPRRIDPSHTYAVDARLTSGTRELHNTEQYVVLTNGAPATVSLVLH